MILARGLAALVRGGSIQSMRISRMIGAVAAAVATCSGCKVLDDDDEPPIDTAGGTGGDTSNAPSCLELVEASCAPGMDVWMNYSGGASNAVLIDDPLASIGVGPNAWLVKVDSETDYVGTYHNDGESCTFACAWCDEGQFTCRGPMTAEGPQGCIMCFADGSPESAAQCTALQAVCLEGKEGEDEGLDETGGGTTGAIGEYDCAAWRPEEGVRRDGSTIIVDASLIEEAMLYHGEPLASCDDTRFRARSDGHFEISRLGQRGLLRSMGLTRGDVILAVNGRPLNSFDAVIQAASMLSVATGFTVTIVRGAERFDQHVSVR